MPFVCGVKENEPITGFYDSRYVILATAKLRINPSADCQIHHVIINPDKGHVYVNADEGLRLKRVHCFFCSAA